MLLNLMEQWLLKRQLPPSLQQYFLICTQKNTGISARVYGNSREDIQKKPQECTSGGAAANLKGAERGMYDIPSIPFRYTNMGYL